MSYGSDYHDHPDLSRSIDESRWDTERKIDDLRDEMREMRRELVQFVQAELAGLSEWIRQNAEHDHAPTSAPKGGK